MLHLIGVASLRHLFEQVDHLPAPPDEVTRGEFRAGLGGGGHAVAHRCAGGPLVDREREPRLRFPGERKVVALLVEDQLAVDPHSGIHRGRHPVGRPVRGAAADLPPVLERAHADDSGEFGGIEFVPDSPTQALGDEQIRFVVDLRESLPLLGDHGGGFRVVVAGDELEIVHLREEIDDPVEGAAEGVGRRRHAGGEAVQIALPADQFLRCPGEQLPVRPVVCRMGPQRGPQFPDLVGVQRGDVVLLNDGDLTYAKVRFDADSAAALVEHIGELHEPLARAITWSSFWDSVRDGDIAPQDFISLAMRGIDSETDMAATSTVLSQAAACAGRFMAPELRREANARLTAGLARLLQHAEAGSDKQVIIAKALVGATRSDEAVELIRGWLNGEEVPAGLAVDTGLRWSIITALARFGAINASVIDAELARDNTSAGSERAAGARAGLPDAEHKAEAWHRATQDADVPNETHSSIAMGFWHLGQEDLTAPYAEKYLDVAGQISTREGIWAERGYAAIGTVLRWLFPDPLISDELVARFEDWLEEGDPSSQVRRSITERLDEAMTTPAK